MDVVVHVLEVVLDPLVEGLRLAVGVRLTGELEQDVLRHLPRQRVVVEDHPPHAPGGGDDARVAGSELGHPDLVVDHATVTDR